jgi:pimeloyl-ACP methyl ester carboxylesterase
VLHDVGRENSVDYLVMELIEGESLAQRLQRGPLAVAEAVRLAAQIADALARAHRAGLVHSDLKPGNVMLARSGAKLSVFGLARWTTAPPASNSPAQAETIEPPTREGALIGTPEYMAPEQLEGREADARTDIWALGCVLYEMLTGRPPFGGSSTASKISAILKDEPPPLGELAPVVPARLDAIVRACLAKDPDQRWQSADDFALALRLPDAAGAAFQETHRPGLVERPFVLTAAHVRQLEDRNPRLIGFPMTNLDNRVDSDILVVYLHGIGPDATRYENVLRASKYRGVAITHVGFGPRDKARPPLGIRDHSTITRLVLRDLVDDFAPRKVILVGHSAGADQFLRMALDPQGFGVDVAGIVALGPNVSIETCFATRLYSQMELGNPSDTLRVLREITKDIDQLESWLVVHNYLSQTFLKFGADLEPLRRYAQDLLEPFLVPGDPLADWYRAARRLVPRVRLVFSNAEAGPAEALLARHLETNVLGDDFVADSFVIEPVHHMRMLDPVRVAGHVQAVLGERS